MDESRPLSGQSGPECGEHPGRGAVAKCVSCGRLVCDWCRVFRWNKNYCRSCAGAAPIPPPVQPSHLQHRPQAYGSDYRLVGDPSPGGYPYYGYQTYPQVPVRRRRTREVVFPGAPWGVGEAVIIFIIAYAITTGLTVSLYVLLRQLTSTTTSVFLLIFLSSVILYALLLAGTFYSVKIRHGSTATALGLRLDNLGGGLAWGLGLGIPLFVGAIFLAYISQQVFRDTNAPDMVSRSVNEIAAGGVSVGLIVLLFVTLVVLAPVCEEIFFRGYLYPALRNRLDMQPAMILNGVMFAAAHFEIIGFLPRFILGYGLCFIYERRHNLAGPMVGHALYNGLILLLSGIFNIF